MKDIVVDVAQTKKEIRKVWNFGYNTCHAALLLRDDLTSQIKEAKESGFRYIRFHNILSSQVGVYSENEKGESIYNFEKFNKIFDTVIQNGMLPFMEISFCPEALKSSEKTIMYYKGNTSKPSSYEKWTALIKKIICNVVERYGIECVKKWYFEVWNEPDLIFFDGDMKDYFELYDYTVLAIKSVDSALKVGGPATSKCKWIDEFIGHIESGSKISGFKPLPCDFISAHAYPSDLPFLSNAHGDVVLQNSNVLVELYSSVKEKIENSSLKGTPLIMGEWNSSAGPLAFNHDEKNNGAFIVKTLNELKDIIDGSLYWNLSDIFEEFGFNYIPFHGGYGLFNVNSIHKSSYNAFKILSMVGGEEIDVGKTGEEQGNGIMASFDKNKGIVNILLYYYVEPDSPAKEAWEANLTVRGIKTETVTYKSFGINDNSGSPYEWWRSIGSPDYLTSETMRFLSEKSEMEENNKILFKDRDEGAYKICEKIYPGDVKLIQISNITQ